MSEFLNLEQRNIEDVKWLSKLPIISAILPHHHIPTQTLFKAPQDVLTSSHATLCTLFGSMVLEFDIQNHTYKIAGVTNLTVRERNDLLMGREPYSTDPEHDEYIRSLREQKAGLGRWRRELEDQISVGAHELWRRTTDMFSGKLVETHTITELFISNADNGTVFKNPFYNRETPFTDIQQKQPAISMIDNSPAIPIPVITQNDLRDKQYLKEIYDYCHVTSYANGVCFPGAFVLFQHEYKGEVDLYVNTVGHPTAEYWIERVTQNLK